MLAQTTTITYQASDDDFPNPERGFYRYSETRSGGYSPLRQDTLEGYRELHVPSTTANYSVYSSLVFRYFFLENFKESNISQEYLDKIQQDFNVARAAGVKIIPRFAYTDAVDGSGCSNWICPPYGDASKAWVLSHIDQLQPVLENNKDVIATVQMGFVGVWGENYYTDFFGDASQPPSYKLLDNHWEDRIEVLNALLDAVPTERMVQVRYPQMKQRTIYGISAPTNSNPLMLNEAFSGLDKARIGFHNDCFLSGAYDSGTYTDYGNSSTPSALDSTNLRPYFADDSQFVVVGGETCNDDFNPQSNCSSTDPDAYGELELERMHYSYLNAQYNNELNNDWVADGCMDEIKKRLGYRFELQEGTFSDAAQPNQVIDIDLDIKNVGYTSPFNERGVELIFRNLTTSEIWFVALDDDPRYWFANDLNHNIAETICLPSDMPVGSYEVLLHLPDPISSIHGIPEFSIRLANKNGGNDVWENATGYNKLGHIVEVNDSANSTVCNGEITLTKLSGPLPIDLLHFDATPQKGQILLSWTTNSEINNQGFYVERKTKNHTLTKIAWIEGSENSFEKKHYQFIDTEVESNVDYQYRLAQKDMDGKITYSNRISASILSDDISDLFRIFPNPARNQFTIDFLGKASIQQDFKCSLFNSSGIRIPCHNLNERTIDISMLPDGLYFIELQWHQHKMYKKIVKKTF